MNRGVLHVRSTRIAPHLPYLRRSRVLFAALSPRRCLRGGYLEALIADVSIFPKTSSDRVSLYQLFVTIFSSVAINIKTDENLTGGRSVLLPIFQQFLPCQEKPSC